MVNSDSALIDPGVFSGVSLGRTIALTKEDTRTKNPRTCESRKGECGDPLWLVSLVRISQVLQVRRAAGMSPGTRTHLRRRTTKASADGGENTPIFLPQKCHQHGRFRTLFLVLAPDIQPILGTSSKYQVRTSLPLATTAETSYAVMYSTSLPLCASDDI